MTSKAVLVARAIHLENGKDKMSGREKRLGNQSAVTAEIVFPNMSLHTASIHLDAHSTQRHRKEQLEAVVERREQKRVGLALLPGELLGARGHVQGL